MVHLIEEILDCLKKYSICIVLIIKKYNAWAIFIAVISSWRQASEPSSGHTADYILSIIIAAMRKWIIISAECNNETDKHMTRNEGTHNQGVRDLYLIRLAHRTHCASSLLQRII